MRRAVFVLARLIGVLQGGVGVVALCAADRLEARYLARPRLTKASVRRVCRGALIGRPDAGLILGVKPPSPHAVFEGNRLAASIIRRVFPRL